MFLRSRKFGKTLFTSVLEKRQREAKEQIEKYSKYDEIQNIEHLHKYTIIAVVDKIYIEEI